MALGVLRLCLSKLSLFSGLFGLHVHKIQERIEAAYEQSAMPIVVSAKTAMPFMSLFFF